MTTKAATAKQPTAAERYADAVDKQFETWLNSSFSREALKGVPLYEHKVPSGMVFKVRNLSQEFLVQSGAVPVGSLSNEVMNTEPEPELTDEEKEQKAIVEFNALPADERVRRLQTVARQVRYICVEPRLILGEVNGHRDAISVSQLSMPDFNSLAARSNPMGGAAAQGLRTFRKKRR